MSVHKEYVIDNLIRANGIENQQKLLVDIFKELDSKDPYGEAAKQKGNFSKMLSGERYVSAEFVVPMEKLLNTSLYSIESGSHPNKLFDNRGIRYTAFNDEIEGYEQLDSEEALGAYDEYGKGILDYIVAYGSINGLRYLVKEKKFGVDPFTNTLLGGFPLTGDQRTAPLPILQLVCDKGDIELFDSIFSPFKRIDNLGLGKWVLTDERAIRMILSSKNILAGLLSSKEIKLSDVNRGLINDADKGYFINPLLFDIASFALQHSEEFENQTKDILTFGIKANAASKKYVESHYKDASEFYVSDEGLIKLGRTIYGNLLITKLLSEPDLNIELTKLLGELNEGINSLLFKNKPMQGGFSKRKVWIENGNIIKESSSNKTEYVFLKLMADNNVSFVPRLIKQENGRDYLTFFKGEVPTMITKEPLDRLSSAARALKTINGVSKKALGNDKVYVHDDFSVMNMVFNDNNLVGIMDWDTLKVGEEYEDLIYLMWTGLNIGDYLRNDEEIITGMKDILKAYGASENLKKDWDKKMIAVMDGRLKKVQRTDSNYRRIFNWVGWSKLFVELNKEEIKEKIG